MADKVVNTSADSDIIQTTSKAQIYLLPRKIQKKRYELLKSLCKKLPLVNEFSPSVTHIVTDCANIEEVQAAIPQAADVWCEDVYVVSTAWLSLSIKEHRVLPVNDWDRLQYAPPPAEPSANDNTCVSSVPLYACQRDTPLVGNNERLTDTFLILEKNSDFIGDERNYSRALAFRNCYAMLKGLPTEVTGLSDLNKLPHCGRHCLQVIRDILENGSSSEAEEVKNSDWFKKMELFTGVFGVGVTTAKKWISHGITNIKDAVSSPHLRNDERLHVGLGFYSDLSSPVPKAEAQFLEKLVSEECQRIKPKTTVLLTGGFIRGKSTGHDVDLLISHPVEGEEKGVLHELLRRLGRRGMILYGKWQDNTFTTDVLRGDSVAGEYLKSHLDHFEKWIGVLKIKKHFGDESSDCFRDSSDPDSAVKDRNAPWNLEDAVKMGQEEREWTARRVDLIVVPASQYYYAKVGWIGSKLFNRSLRTYAKRELGMTLTSHGLYHNHQSIPAHSEEEVFENLKLDYRDPTLRNC